MRDDITAAYPICRGEPGASPEVHEKISGATGRGVVVCFAEIPGAYTHVTTNTVAQSSWISAGIELSLDERGRAELRMSFERPGAMMAFFA